MKKILIVLSLILAPALFAQAIISGQPGMVYPQTMGMIGEQPGNMITNSPCPPQIAPQQMPLTQQNMMPLQNMYNQQGGAHVYVPGSGFQ